MRNLVSRSGGWLLALCVAAPAMAAPDKPAPVPTALERATHGAYVAAINSNNLDTLVAEMTDDVVYQTPGAPEVVGKQAVRIWCADYLAGYKIKWDKTSLGFTFRGDVAFERYTYKSTDIDRKTGAVSTDAGKGINIFRRGKDGKWRVAVDSWSSDKKP